MPTRNQFEDDNSFLQALQDWFAGQALAGLLASISTTDAARAFADGAFQDGDSFAVHAGSMAYELADAMLAARTQGDGE
jgi:hypothetical protein